MWSICAANAIIVSKMTKSFATNYICKTAEEKKNWMQNIMKMNAGESLKSFTPLTRLNCQQLFHVLMDKQADFRCFFFLSLSYKSAILMPLFS